MAEAEAAPKVTLEEVEDLRALTKRIAYPSWVAFFVFGALVLAAIPFALAGDDGYDGYYWLAAGPFGGAVTWLLVSRRGEAIGLVDRRFRSTAAIIAAMVIGALIVGWSGESAASEAGTVYPIAAGLVAIGALNRNALIAGTGVALALWATAVIAIDPGEAAAWAYAGEGAILIAAGASALARVR